MFYDLYIEFLLYTHIDLFLPLSNRLESECTFDATTEAGFGYESTLRVAGRATPKTESRTKTEHRPTSAGVRHAVTYGCGAEAVLSRSSPGGEAARTAGIAGVEVCGDLRKVSW